MQRFLILIGLNLASAAWGGDAVFRPYLAEVTNLTAGDHLNIRAAASGRSEDLGDLQSGDLIEITAPTENPNWVRILDGGVDGYIAKSYTRAVKGALGPFGLIAPLVCAGTEPFWSLTLAHDAPELRFKAAEGTTWRANVTRQSGALDGAPYQAEFFTKEANIKIAALECSDGMSDQTYGWDIELSTDNGTLYGCCTLQGSR